MSPCDHIIDALGEIVSLASAILIAGAVVFGAIVLLGA